MATGIILQLFQCSRKWTVCPFVTFASTGRVVYIWN